MSLEGPNCVYETSMGRAYVGDAIDVLQETCEDDSVDLVMTSPPFALSRAKEYGNQSQDDYVRWFQAFADEFWRILKPTGSLVIDLGGAWQKGHPVKSLYRFELLISLCRRPSTCSTSPKTSTGSIRPACQVRRNGSQLIGFEQRTQSTTSGGCPRRRARRRTIRR